MRISIRPTDRGFVSFEIATQIKVLLDDVEVEKCITADQGGGVLLERAHVICYATDKNGNLIGNGLGGYKELYKEGKVTILLNDKPITEL